MVRKSSKEYPKCIPSESKEWPKKRIKRKLCFKSWMLFLLTFHVPCTTLDLQHRSRSSLASSMSCVRWTCQIILSSGHYSYHLSFSTRNQTPEATMAKRPVSKRHWSHHPGLGIVASRARYQPQRLPVDVTDIYFAVWWGPVIQLNHFEKKIHQIPQKKKKMFDDLMTFFFWGPKKNHSPMEFWDWSVKGLPTLKPAEWRAVLLMAQILYVLCRGNVGWILCHMNFFWFSALEQLVSTQKTIIIVIIMIIMITITIIGMCQILSWNLSIWGLSLKFHRIWKFFLGNKTARIHQFCLRVSSLGSLTEMRVNNPLPVPRIISPSGSLGDDRKAKWIGVA